MKEVQFSFRGKSYKGFVAVSTEAYPHYYWCFIDDPELVKEVGDCISFQQEKGGELRPSEYYPRQYSDLVQILRVLVEQTIAAGTLA